MILILSACFVEGVCEMSISQLLAGHLVLGAVGDQKVSLVCSDLMESSDWEH